jgi:murein DD-endopeptidase MepM/ murein hydrolase activator NlpD
LRKWGFGVSAFFGDFRVRLFRLEQLQDVFITEYRRQAHFFGDPGAGCIIPPMYARFPGVCFFFLLLAGCGPAAPGTTQFPTPVRWQSPTPSPSLFFPTREVSLTPTLAPTPTPRTYTVVAGDTFGSIASKFGISVDALTRANPGVDPNALPIGTVLIIPARASGSETPPPSPTPVGLTIEPGYCYAQTGGGKWCLALVGNPGSDAVTGIYLRFMLYSSPADDPAASKEAALPVTILPAGERTIAAVYFAPEETQAEILRVVLVSAVRAGGTQDILPLTVLKEEPRALSDGLELSVEFRIDSTEELSANRLDAVLVLLDAAGRPVGFRILRGEGEWPAGLAHRLTLNAFSLGGEWTDYEFILQARSVPSAA